MSHHWRSKVADVQIRVDCDPLHTGQKRLGNRVREYDKGTSAAFILRVHRLLSPLGHIVSLFPMKAGANAEYSQ